MLNNRLLAELGLLDEYKSKHNWFKDFTIIDENPLTIKFKLLIKNFTYEFIANFPRFYPNQPIIVNKITEFNTKHSYKNGTMCLKYGNDNWNENLNIISIIGNLYELIYDENPLGNKHDKSSNGELLSLGQKIRYINDFCIILPKNLLSFCKENGNIEIYSNKVNMDKIIYFMSKVDNISFVDTKKRNCKSIKYIKTDLNKNSLTSKKIRKIINNKYIRNNEVLLIITKDNYPICVKLQNDELKLVKIIINNDEIDKRSGLDSKILNKKIVIIGLGSVGSRVFLDLARARFNNFYLCDDDIMMPYNTLRHELNDNDVGEYKVIALKKIVEKNINKNVQIKTSILNVNGQESSKSIDDFLNECLNASIIIDCTADDNLLLILDSLVQKYHIPLLSGTIIPGGLGNIIMYRKSYSTLTVNDILSGYYKWLNSVEIFGKKNNDYTTTIDNQTFIATMSDCSILSGLLGKYCINILSGKENLFNDITVFSTSNYKDLSNFNKCYNITINNELLNLNNNDDLNTSYIEKGKIIYENYNKSKNKK